MWALINRMNQYYQTIRPSVINLFLSARVDAGVQEYIGWRTDSEMMATEKPQIRCIDSHFEEGQRSSNIVRSTVIVSVQK